MRSYYLDDRPAFVKIVDIENDIIELDGFVVMITDSSSFNIKLKKGGKEVMNEIELKKLIDAYREDLSEAVAKRDKIANEDVEAKIEDELALQREEIAERVRGEHEDQLSEANKTVELMQIIIAKRENQLEQLLVDETNNTENEGE